MATLMPTAAARQPFAPINASRLQNLTSLKNRQNAVSVSSPIKRKAHVYEDDDSENVDPVILLSPKRTKGSESYVKTSSTHFVLTKAPSAPKESAPPCSPIKGTTSRPILQARSPAPRINTSTIDKQLTAPAGRSPTRKRVGILNRRRTTAGGSPFTRIDPPKFSVGASNDCAAPFSIAAALSGTIPSYGARARAAPAPTVAEPAPIVCAEGGLNMKKDTWFFDIHEDTEEETLHNLMYHSTCTLDISSDEETEARRRDDRGKENVPPVDDISQSQARLPRDASTKARTSSKSKFVDESAIDIDRSPLADLEAEDFYAEGCGALDVILVVDDTEADASEPEPEKSVPSFEFSIEAQVKGKGRAIEDAVELLMGKSEAEAPQHAALFEPIEKAEEGFEVWESGSAKDETESADL